MNIVKVTSKRQMRDFVRLPQTIHGKSPCYAPPLWADENKAYSAKSNPILKNSDFELFLAVNDEGKAVGRTIAYIDHTFNRHYKTKMGFFGAYECIDDDSAGRLLAKAAEEWLLGKGMDTIRGPIHPAAENWGFVVNGYESPPVYMSPWNPHYYHRFFADLGYEKTKDLLVYEADSEKGYAIPERFHRLYEKYFERYPNISIRRLNTRNIKEDAHAIWEISNSALADNWGFVPLELPVMEDMLRKLKLIVDPDAVWMVEDNGKPVGFCLGFPDINILLRRINGRLLPFGWARLLLGLRKLKDYRLFGLAVHPDWQKNALDALMYINLYKHLAPRKIRVEANYILEDNLGIKNALEKLGLEYIKTYRIYEKPLLSSI
jgi:ribosomal protein S18 acetylase RimI-like enzyme